MPRLNMYIVRNMGIFDAVLTIVFLQIYNIVINIFWLNSACDPFIDGDNEEASTFMKY